MSKNPTLLQRAEDKIALWQLIEQNEGELDATLEAWLTEVETNLLTKVDSYKFCLDELKAESERIRQEAQSLYNAARSIDRIRDALNERIKMVMLAMGSDSLTGTTYRFKLSNGTKRLVIDPEQIPENFKIIKTTYEIDKERVRDSLESGNQLPGAHLEESHQLRVYLNKGN